MEDLRRALWREENTQALDERLANLAIGQGGGVPASPLEEIQLSTNDLFTTIRAFEQKVKKVTRHGEGLDELIAATPEFAAQMLIAATPEFGAEMAAEQKRNGMLRREYVRKRWEEVATLAMDRDGNPSAATLNEIGKVLRTSPASLDEVDLANDLIKTMKTFEQKLLAVLSSCQADTPGLFDELDAAMPSFMGNMMAVRDKAVEIRNGHECKKEVLEEQLEKLKERELENEFENLAAGQGKTDGGTLLIFLYVAANSLNKALKLSPIDTLAFDLPVFVDEVAQTVLFVKEHRQAYKRKLEEFKSKKDAIEEREKALEEFMSGQDATEAGEKALEEFMKREIAIEEVEKAFENARRIDKEVMEERKKDFEEFKSGKEAEERSDKAWEKFNSKEATEERNKAVEKAVEKALEEFKSIEEGIMEIQKREKESEQALKEYY